MVSKSSNVGKFFYLAEKLTIFPSVAIDQIKSYLDSGAEIRESVCLYTA